MSDEQIEAYVNLANQKKLTGKKEIDVENALSKFVQFTHSHRSANHTAQLFMDFDTDRSGKLTIDEFENVLRDSIHLTRREIDLIKEKFFMPGVTSFNYTNFLKVLQTYTDAKKKGKFLGNGYKPPSLKQNYALS